MLNLGLVSKACLVALTLALLALAWSRRNDAARATFALIVVVSLNTEFFLPHRWGYADVMLLAPVTLMLPAILSSPLWGRAAGGEGTTPQTGDVSLPVVLVVFGAISGLLIVHFDLYLATLLRSWLVMAGLTLLALGKPAVGDPPAPAAEVKSKRQEA